MAETPPASAIVLIFNSFAAFNVFSNNTFVTAFSKLAAKSALFTSGFLWCKLITAVFIPLKLKSKFSKWVSGRGIFASPSLASLSIFGPPGYPRPITLATLSNASPIASSLVLPSISNSF